MSQGLTSYKFHFFRPSLNQPLAWSLPNLGGKPNISVNINGRIVAANAPRLGSLGAADPDAIVVVLSVSPLRRATVAGILVVGAEGVHARDGTFEVGLLIASELGGGGTDGAEGDGELERAKHGGLGMKFEEAVVSIAEGRWIVSYRSDVKV